MNTNDKIFVAGHNGLIGSAIVRRLIQDGYTRILTKNRSELDLTNQAAVKSFFEREMPDYIFFAAAKVGGIFANTTYRAEFIYENIMIQTNVIHCAFLSEVKKMVFLACGDVYPVNCPQPAKEECLLTGMLEATCEPFALAKIAGIKMCESYNRQYGTDFIVLIPPNIYGPKQHYDTLNAQVLPSLISKFHTAKVQNSEEVTIWGTGLPARDFLFVDDVADACMFLTKEYSGTDVFNIGTGNCGTILSLAEIVKETVRYEGKITFDIRKPDGVLQKLLDVSRIKELGWQHRTSLKDGVEITYKAFLDEIDKKAIRTSLICQTNVCEKDTVALKTISTNNGNAYVNEQPNTYKDRVVVKPWGYEFLVFENKVVAVWLLYIKKGYSTSMHCHPQKKTSLILLSGNAMSNTFLQRRYLRGGDAIIIEKGVFHSTKTLSDDGVFLLETETPPNKVDLIRLEDRYGRETIGYEGVTEMETKNLNEFDYFHYEESSPDTTYHHQNSRFSVTFEVFPNSDEFQRTFKVNGGELYTSCEGGLLDANNTALLSEGNTQKAEILKNARGLHISEKTILLKTLSNDIK
ncbi:NAD-dependent epimerase/dehydratase [Candidatus Brocadia pituitae]|nr:NAD-dependent epimerase/dehydratase [Candidatus Brocadia pituitae]